ncbi:aromatic ring-hydroxylating oxygenase subunit alpha [Nocardia macrotermitis]|uniref:3-phenylpropionate/cinnamic acid dioxygenase subunit alpha n=1 Tax=Nocardia macrotermitis TaxID=2585198 RepID=A0A7K0D828_9NOCA|nr:aromatic ring-hydroxylating dioxygenase subunit alpha [Nocardia macrotermitis]MQY21729.1 3-phenylpropionate/cinnamic acid dioxygenase subunit alpha [Nocardia macrotermitis]
MRQWPKPAEGSWTEHYPDLGTGAISFEDSVSPEFFELEREAIFKRAWLNVGRVEQLRRTGSYFTKEIDAARTSIIVVRDRDGGVNAFHNVCRHRGNKLVWTDDPRAESAGVCRQFTCKYHGWRYGLDGELEFVQQPGEFFDLDAKDSGLVRVHCGVWNGFIFVNLAEEPPQTLREFLGPMVTALDDYPFDRMTEWYEFTADNRSNWKLFADAFQEYYHVPGLHPQQIPNAVRTGKGFECAHFQLDGPHRMVSTGGARRWTLPPEFMYPIERITRSGLVGPWESPELGDMPTGLNPGRVEPWGIDNFQIFPNIEILVYRGWYLLYRYWPTSYNTHRFEGMLCYQPARTVRERVEHEVSSVVFKEFALQDAGMLTGTQTALEQAYRSAGITRFPVNDQEILVRHFHHAVADWVDRYRTEVGVR